MPEIGCPKTDGQQQQRQGLLFGNGPRTHALDRILQVLAAARQFFLFRGVKPENRQPAGEDGDQVGGKIRDEVFAPEDGLAGEFLHDAARQNAGAARQNHLVEQPTGVGQDHE